MSFLEDLKSKPWFPWAVGAGVLVLIFWLLFWSTLDPGPMSTSRGTKGKDRKEDLYDLKIGSWQNRVDQDLEATKKQLKGAKRAAPIQSRFRMQLSSEGCPLSIKYRNFLTRW
jgi:hypothetical protein